MKAIILGTQSFMDTCGKVGIQYIAEGLARRGWSVDYVPNASSPFDALFSSRRERFKRAWVERLDVKGFHVEKGLVEYPLRAPFPTRREFLRFKWQLRLYPALLPSFIRDAEYDLCIHDSSSAFFFLPKIKAKRIVYRLNDLPSGFSHAYHEKIIGEFDRMVRGGSYYEIWAVSRPLAEYAGRLNPSNRVVLMPNGVDMDDLTEFGCADRQPRSAVFVGNILPWVDVEIVDAAASRLPDWVIDFYGPILRDWKVSSKNVRYRGVVDRRSLVDVLKRYTVGLIPLRDVSGRAHTVERPVKFYNYLAAGLGVAASDLESLRLGMDGWACYGSTPEEFAEAMRAASASCTMERWNKAAALLRDNSWDKILDGALERVGLCKA